MEPKARNMAGASLTTRTGAATMQQWPDPPNEPQPIQQPPSEAPAAPHTPTAPVETPQPGDGDNDSERA